MSINLLYEKLINLPTILNIEDEISVINDIQQLDLNEIKADLEKFIKILSHIQESHQDNGIFEVSSANVHIFRDYAVWVRNIQKDLDIDIESYIDGFETNFDNSIKIS